MIPIMRLIFTSVNYISTYYNNVDLMFIRMRHHLPINERSLFISGGSSIRQSRLQQLIDWCGGEKFEGCLVFDECHKAKNFIPVSSMHLYLDTCLCTCINISIHTYLIHTHLIHTDTHTHMHTHTHR